MIPFILLILSGIWLEYNFFSYVYGWWYVDLIQTGNFIIGSLNVISIKWSFPLGLLFIAYGILGIIFRKSEDTNLSQFKWGALIISLFLSICVML